MKNGNLSRTSLLVAEYRRSPFAAIWQKLWRIFPRFSIRYSPFFLFEDGAVLWNQGFGNIAYLKGSRSLTIAWSLASSQRGARIIYLSAAKQWDPPHEEDELSQSEIDDLRKRLTMRFRTRGEDIVFE
jgi:hypothetical protein